MIAIRAISDIWWVCYTTGLGNRDTVIGSVGYQVSAVAGAGGGAGV